VHDHWVDGIGDDVITDFNTAQGDKITITGHTTEVYQIDIADADGDGAADDSVLHLRSNQGAAGAHHLDLLGTISVLNNELTAADFTVDANSTAGRREHQPDRGGDKSGLRSGHGGRFRIRCRRSSRECGRDRSRVRHGPRPRCDCRGRSSRRRRSGRRGRASRGCWN
jgi:hypothetical protein